MMARASMIAVLLALVGLSVSAAFVFTFEPGIDLAVSALFFDGTRFIAANHAGLQMFRELIWWVSIAICLFALFMAVATTLRRSASVRIAPRVWWFVVLVYVTGPIVMANLILKDHWGRARPRAVEEFGGDRAFSPALEIVEECARNCSFVSGEASGAVATALVLSLLIAPALERARAVFHSVVWSVALFASVLRIAMGGHFLSDVVFAGLFTAILTGLLYLALRLHEELPVEPANVFRDLRDLFRRRGS